jgi:hypothetical protein
MITIDPLNEHTFTSLFVAGAQATNNTASAGVNLQSYIGQVAVRIIFGVPLAGNAGCNISIQLQSSATNNANNATNIAGASFTSTSNNVASNTTIAVDPRAVSQFLFGLITLNGSANVPVAAEVIGTKRLQLGGGSPQQ